MLIRARGLGDNRLRAFAAKLSIAFALTSVTPGVSAAGIEQLDILGLTLGKSTREQVRSASTTMVTDTTGWFEIGGYNVPCGAEFDGDKMKRFLCALSAEFSNASNTEIFSTLLEGWTKKFGKPLHVRTETVRNRLGVEFKSMDVLWKDQRGNSLILSNMASQIDQGTVIFVSASESEKLDRERKKKETARKF